MAKLVLLQGGVATPFVLRGRQAWIGRHPECDVQLDSNMVSRHHARAFREGNAWQMADHGSGNGTFVNGAPLSEPVTLHHGDRVKVGPVLLRFEDEDAPLAVAPPVMLELDADDAEETTRTESVTNESGFGLLSARPEKKLKSIIAISRRLASTTHLKDLLPNLLDTLFEIFPAADRGVILIRAAETGKFIPAAEKQRNPSDDATVRLSKTILKKVVDDKAGVLSADAAHDQQFSMSESVSDLAIRSMMCAPLIGLDGDVTGVINLDTQNPIARFNKDDLDLLLAVAGQAALNLESARLLVSHIEKVKQDREMEIARDVQRALLPEAFPDVPGYEFFASYESAEAVGGDYYDAFLLPDGRVCLSFGDVAGKGVPGALIMSRLASCVQIVMRHVDDLGRAFAAINLHMCAKMAEGRFVTYVLAVIDPERHELTLCNGGHMAPMIRAPDGTMTEFDEESIGLPIGVIPDYPYEVVRRALAPGETIVITTDGVDEAMNEAGTLYTRRRAFEFISEAQGHARELTQSLLADVRRHAAGRPQNDDITIMSFGRTA